jgi:hypothetical protein
MPTGRRENAARIVIGAKIAICVAIWHRSDIGGGMARRGQRPGMDPLALSVRLEG